MVAVKSFLSAGAVALLLDVVSAQTFQRLGTCPKLGEYCVDQLTYVVIDMLILLRMYISTRSG